MSVTSNIEQLTLLEHNRFEGMSTLDLNMVEQDTLISLALSVLANRYQKGQPLTSPAMMREYFQVRYGELEHEVFSMVMLDNRHRLIDVEEMFRGTIDGASVYPREVVKAALKWNAAAVAFIHNHPSGITQPSDADKRITERLKDALALIDVRVLDHLIVTHESTVSFAERGLL
ncbi:DNA repair protein RadC [Candidatus Thiodiazotropha endoloripes]|nr:DNA repair protein RadC [Candidatus Thiodiazotropha weberae]ODB95083.1 DNA repair protein RadC [Candidatus Thiodiazotropha endoloripes]